jgi:putative chitinase
MTSIGRNQFLQQTMGKALELNRISPADNQKLQQHGFNLQELQQLDINNDGKIAGPDETSALLQKLDEFEATSGASPQVMDEIKKQLASLFREAGPGHTGGLPQPGGAPTAGNQRGAQGLNAGHQPMAPPRQASAPRPRGGQQPQAMSPLQQAIASGNPPKPGDEGPAVAELQQLLKALGLPVDVNGKFDEKTLGAVQQLASTLQQAAGQGPQQGGPQAPGGAPQGGAPAGGAPQGGAPQAPSGAAPAGGPQAAGQNPMQGMEGPQVAQLQQMLKALGLPVDVNGKLDGKTMEAMKQLLQMLQQALSGQEPQKPQQKGGPQGGAPAGGGGGAPRAPQGGGKAPTGGRAPQAPQGGNTPAPAGGNKAPAPAGGNTPRPANNTPAPKPAEGGNVPKTTEGGSAPPTTPVNNTAPVTEAHNNADPGGVTPTQLRQIVPTLSAERAEQVAPHLNRAMAEANINTPQRQAMFIAQLAHESGGFRYNEELASGADYEGRADLGNTQPGDGRRFKGRGFIQLTGRDNYTRAGRDLGLDLVNNPGLAAEDGNAARVAAWYWNSRDINSAADSGNFTQVTRLINGGTNGLPDRQQYYARAREALGI